MEFEEIAGYKGTSKWYSRAGFFYVGVTRDRRPTVSMRCAATGCRVRWNLKNGQAGPIVGQHNHEPTPWIPNRNIMFQNLKRRSEGENTPLHNIFIEEAARYPDASPHLLYESVVSSMRRWRKTNQPGVPRTVTAYGMALTNHPIHQEMALATVTAGGASAVILSMPGFGECLRDSGTIIVDGTFQTVPAGLPVAQIVTMHGVVGGNFFHPILILMENRRRILYEAVFQRIWNAAGNPRPQHVVTDFEPALQAALEAVTRVRVQGCLFHFIQALLRRARYDLEGFVPQRGTPGWTLVQVYGSLALLPPALVPVGLAEIPAICAAEGLPVSDAFAEYFQTQWMTRVGPARFSVHGSPHLTSNVAESFHASLGRLLGPAPNIWRFTDVAAQIFAVSVSRLQAHRGGNLRWRNRVRSYIRATRLAQNERALNMGIITVREFLVASARNMVVGLAIVEDVPDVAAEVIIEARPVAELVVVDHHHQPLPELEDVVEDFMEELPEIVFNNPPQQPPAPEVIVDDDQQPLPEPVIVVEDIRPPAPEVVVDHDYQQPIPLQAGPRCGICLENIATQVLVRCGHVLCPDCLVQLANQEICPFCRGHVIMAIPFFI